MALRHVINLGAGVQSSTLALAATLGVIEPMPEVAIFADTGWESQATYWWLQHMEKLLAFPVVRVAAGNIRDDNVEGTDPRTPEGAEPWEGAKGEFRTSMPFFVQATDGRTGPTRRKCTVEYKIQPINEYLRRELLGIAKHKHAPREPVISAWMGISRDEASRMKPSREKWKEHRYPLAMELGWTRDDCKRWLSLHGFPTPPRSSCIGCPYHTDAEWRRIRDETPEEWADAVAFDRAIRNAPGLINPAFLHRSLLPLDEVDLATPEDRGQLTLFGDECYGMCGV